MHALPHSIATMLLIQLSLANDLLQCNKYIVVKSTSALNQPIHVRCMFAACNEILWMKLEDVTKFWEENVTDEQLM